jgi:hypothetical protein
MSARVLLIGVTWPAVGGCWPATEVSVTTPVPRWVEVTATPEPEPVPDRPAWWFGALEKIFATIVVLGLIAIGGSVAARAAADRDAIDEAMGLSDLFVRTALQPVLSDDVLSSSPEERRRRSPGSTARCTRRCGARSSCG